MLVDLRPFGVTGKVAQEALDRAGITCNKNAIPNDPEKPFVTSGLRLGTASVTTAGMGADEMREIASLIGAGAARRRRRGRRGRGARPGQPPLLEVHAVPGGLTSRTGAARVKGYCGRRRGRARHDAADDADRAAGSRSGSARWSQPSSDARHVHTKPTPTLGGAAMFVGFLAAMAVASQMHAVPRDVPVDNSEPVGLLLGAGVMFVDRRARRPHRGVAAREARRARCSRRACSSLFGVTMFFFRMPFNLFHTDVVVLVARPRAARDRGCGSC